MTMYTHREGIQRLGDQLAEHDATHQTISFVRDHATMTMMTTTSGPAGKRRRPSMIERSINLVWLSSKIDKFSPRSWWAGSFIIAIRIMQTSIMVLFSNPSLQAAAASLIALVGVAVQTHAAPYRQASDNRAALAAAWLLFLWPFLLLVRDSEAVGGEHGVVLGALLIAATVVVMAFTVYALVADVKKYATNNNDCGDSTQPVATQTTVVIEEDQAAPATEAPVSLGTGVIVGIDLVDRKTTAAAHDDEEERNSACVGCVVCSL